MPLSLKKLLDPGLSTAGETHILTVPLPVPSIAPIHSDPRQHSDLLVRSGRERGVSNSRQESDMADQLCLLSLNTQTLRLASLGLEIVQGWSPRATESGRAEGGWASYPSPGKIPKPFTFDL